jgi:hypothetical protein
MAGIAGAIEGIGGGIAGAYGSSDNVWGKEKTTGNEGQKAPAGSFAGTTVPTEEQMKKSQFQSPLYSLVYPQ